MFGLRLAGLRVGCTHYALPVDQFERVQSHTMLRLCFNSIGCIGPVRGVDYEVPPSLKDGRVVVSGTAWGGCGVGLENAGLEGPLALVWKAGVWKLRFFSTGGVLGFFSNAESYESDRMSPELTR